MRRHWIPIALVVFSMALPLNAASILFIGGQPEAAAGDDTPVQEYLEDVLMHSVEYQPANESSSGDEDGFDLLILSSTFGSGDARGKFQDADIPIMQWEEALTRWDHGDPDGNFRLSEFSRNGGGREAVSIAIRPNAVGHPLAAGLPAGEHEIFTDASRTPMAFGELAPGLIPIADLCCEDDGNTMDGDEEATLWTNADGVVEEGFPIVYAAIEKDGELGPPGDGFFAPEKRVNFPLEDVGFSFLNDTGLALFDASVNWLLGVSSGEPGDFNGDGLIDAADIDSFVAGDATFDLTGDGVADDADRAFWITDIVGTWVGDANLDGEFNSSDFVAVFQAGKFENPNAPAGWAEGDWNSDGVFNSGDFVAAFQDGGFELGPRPAVAAVPEPSSISLMLLGCLAFLRRSRR